MTSHRPDRAMPSYCPACKGEEVGVDRRQVAQTIKGRSLQFWEEFSKCADCGEEFFTREQSLASSRAHAAAVRKADGLLSPEAIREARLSLDLTQEQFEEALGVGKKTVVRWERGTVPPSSAANGLLWLAARYPSIFLEYARARLEGQGLGVGSQGRIVARTEVASPATLILGMRFDTSQAAPKQIRERISTDGGTVLQTGGTGGQS